MSDHVEIQITCGTDAEADVIALALVERRLAACVQRLPIRSTYRWRGTVERDDEVLLLVKTRRDRYDAVERAATRIQVMLGHKKLETTTVYAHVATEVLREVVSPLESATSALPGKRSMGMAAGFPASRSAASATGSRAIEVQSTRRSWD